MTTIPAGTPRGLTRAVYRLTGSTPELYVEVPGGLTAAEDYVDDGGPVWTRGTIEELGALAYVGNLSDAAIVALVDEE